MLHRDNQREIVDCVVELASESCIAILDLIVLVTSKGLCLPRMY